MSILFLFIRDFPIDVFANPLDLVPVNMLDLRADNLKAKNEAKSFFPRTNHTCGTVMGILLHVVVI